MPGTVDTRSGHGPPAARRTNANSRPATALEFISDLSKNIWHALTFILIVWGVSAPALAWLYLVIHAAGSLPGTVLRITVPVGTSLVAPILTAASVKIFSGRRKD